jgi:hypothetical protein
MMKKMGEKKMAMLSHPAMPERASSVLQMVQRAALAKPRASL